MLRNLSWDATDSLIRTQFALFDSLGDKLRLTENDRWFLLDLDETDWAEWSAFVADGPLPSAPMVAELLRRLAEATFTLSVLAERAGR